MTIKIGTLLMACLLALAACAGLTIYDPVPGQPDGLGDGEEEPVYQMDPLLSERQFRTQDGKKELARYSYRLCALSVSNMDVLSGEAAVEAARNVETFNARMTLLMEGYVEFGEAMGADAAEVVGAAAYYDEVCAEGFRAGEYISIRLDSVGYTGGAHPNRYASSCLFDLRAGQFVDPAQIAEDPEEFRAGAAALLLEKAELCGDREQFWEDYADVITRWNEGTVVFDGEGMHVVYSPYELGPYAIGEVELVLTYEELAPLAGESAMERLGRTAE